MFVEERRRDLRSKAPGLSPAREERRRQELSLSLARTEAIPEGEPFLPPRHPLRPPRRRRGGRAAGEKRESKTKKASRGDAQGPSIKKHELNGNAGKRRTLPFVVVAVQKKDGHRRGPRALLRTGEQATDRLGLLSRSELCLRVVRVLPRTKKRANPAERGTEKEKSTAREGRLGGSLRKEKARRDRGRCVGHPPTTPPKESADYLVDPASSHMLLSRTKAMQVSEQIRGSSPVPSADGSLHQQSSTRRSGRGPTGPHSPLGYQA